MPDETENNEITRQIAFKITGVFEAPSYSTIQTIDSGIISYGQHQATLASGTLEVILQRYIQNSTSSIAAKLKPFMARVAAKDRTLKNDQTFLNLLKDAGKEQTMIDAQDSIFTEKYWLPAVAKAQTQNLKSPLAFACFYDTNVQGGLANSVDRTTAKLAGTTFTEQKYIQTFLASRRERLLEIAARQINSTVASTKRNGQMLVNAAKFRIGSLMDLADANNLNLVGTFKINGKDITGRDASTVLERGNDNESVGILQDNLIKLGYITSTEIGANRGKFGPRTETAVKAFQKDVELTETGKFAETDQKVLNAILSGFGKGVNVNESLTKIIQKQLVKLSLLTQTEVDTGFGIFGPKTEKAVKTFQKTNNFLPENGIVQAETFRAMFTTPIVENKVEEEVFSATAGEHYTALSDVLMTKDLEKKVAKLANTYFGLTGKNLVVTSGYRPPFRQAPAIYDNIILKGTAVVRGTYKNKKLIDEILAAFQANKANPSNAKAAMQKVIENQVKRGEFISNHLLSNAIDLRTRTTIKAKLQQTLNRVGGRLVDEGNHYHVELH
jgi:peptidoglycan hydrolase-like protein with peptidoglycan-binding domain